MVPSERVRLMDPWVDCLDNVLNSVTPLRLPRDWFCLSVVIKHEDF